jgi:hypothetical protein
MDVLAPNAGAPYALIRRADALKAHIQPYESLFPHLTRAQPDRNQTL